MKTETKTNKWESDSPMPEGFKFYRGDWIYFQDLARYGFDNEIIAGLMKHEIMPMGIKYKGKVYLPKTQIVGLINSMLKVNLQVRDKTDELEKMSKETLETVSNELVTKGISKDDKSIFTSNDLLGKTDEI